MKELQNKELKLNNDILNIVKEFKDQFSDEGLIIEGIFGSYSRGDFNSNSDIDILFDLNKEFRNKYRGFKAIARLDAIQNMMSQRLKIKVDLVQKSSLNMIGLKYILPEIFYV
jgi:predicted nucleotidyltransferase